MLDNFKFTNYKFKELNLGATAQKLSIKLPTANLQLNASFDIDAINERLENGDLTALEDLKKQGISVTTSESEPFTGNDGATYKTTKFTYKYNGQRYTITYNEKVEPEKGNSGAEAEPAEPATPSTPDSPVASATPTPKPTQTTKEPPKVDENAGALENGVKTPKFALENMGFKSEDIEKYFVYMGGKQKFYVLKSGITYDGKNITTPQALLQAIKESAQKAPAADSTPTEPTPTEPTPTEPTPTVETNLTTAYTDLTNAVNLAAKSTGYQARLTAEHFNGKFDINTAGDIVFSDNETTKVYNKVLSEIKDYIKSLGKDSSLTAIGGEAGLAKLVQSAWLLTYNSFKADDKKIDTESFVNKLMANLKSILENLSKNPDNLDYFTNNCFKDASLKSTSYNKINSINYQKYDNDGLYHLDDTRSDASFQNAMNTLLKKLYNKYPNISKAKLKDLFARAQGEALASAKNETDIPANISINNKAVKLEISISDMIQLVLYKFDKLLKTECLYSTLPAREAETTPAKAKSNQTEEQNNNIKEGVKGIAREVTDAVNTLDLIYAQDKKKTMHTEFGMNAQGKIIFQNDDTKDVYNSILNTLKSKIKLYSADALTILGGDYVLEMLVQNAWITTYNSFDSSQSNNKYDFVKKVMENFQKMLNKLQTNPELLETFTKRSSYADSSITTGVKHYNTKTTYGGDEKISTRGDLMRFTDGSIHIDNTDDDNDYQSTMSDVLNQLIEKYSSIEADIVTNVFRAAQWQALDIAKTNKFDCPYGTGNNSHRVEDSSKDWGGKDNRKGDDYVIDMDQLVQLTLYCFDKLIMDKLLKS